jgi:hypothetical protein|tara:strand:- start:317 stop:715 length:399 start_codon:yes stop_codon:yes gene_type:complete
MPIESASDFTSYLDSTAHGVSATFIEKQQNFFDDLPLIDTVGFIDEGITTLINLIIDQEYLNIIGGSVPVEGYSPKAIIKKSDAPFISQNDEIRLNAITTNKGNTIIPQTNFKVKEVQPDNLGMVTLVLEKQ